MSSPGLKAGWSQTHVGQSIAALSSVGHPMSPNYATQINVLPI